MKENFVAFDDDSNNDARHDAKHKKHTKHAKHDLDDKFLLENFFDE